MSKVRKTVQLVGESAEQYKIALYQLTENCEYGKLKSEMIRNRLVVGTQDNNLSQMNPKLTLVKAKARTHQKEAIYHQQGIKQTKAKLPSGIY